MRRTLAAVAIATIVATGCGDLLEPAAAVVNGKKITIDDVNAGLDQLEKTQQYQQLTDQGDVQAYRREFEQTYLSQLIRRAVFEPEAAERGIEVTDADVDARIDEIRDDYANQSAFEESLREQGLTLDQLPELVRDLLLTEELRAAVTEGVEPTEEELRAYYKENLDQYKQTRAQHILVETEAKAEQLAERLKSAGKKEVDDLFARLAREFSRDTSNAKDAGDLGFFSAGELVKPFERAVDRLRIGEVSSPVETEFGWHVIRVTDRRKLTFEDARPDIARRLSGPAQDEAWQEWIAEAYAEADVEVNPRYGELDPESQLVVNPAPEDLPGVETPGLTN